MASPRPAGMSGLTQRFKAASTSASCAALQRWKSSGSSRSGSKRSEVSSNAAICSASRALIESGVRLRPRLGLFERSATGERPRAILVREFATLDFDSFEDIVDEFLGAHAGLLLVEVELPAELVEALARTGKFNIRVGAYPEPHPDAADATANSRINARLPYIFLLSRIAHYLKLIQREKRGQDWHSLWVVVRVDSCPAKNQPVPQAARRAPTSRAVVSNPAGERCFRTD